MIQPYSMADDLRGEAMAEVGVGWRLHAASLARSHPRRQLRLPFTVTMPEERRQQDERFLEMDWFAPRDPDDDAPSTLPVPEIARIAPRPRLLHPPDPC